MVKLEENIIADKDAIDVRTGVQYYSMDARKIDCPIAKQFLNKLPFIIDKYSPTIVDSRVSMLQPGWLPCIGGWHYDEITRDSGGNLDYVNNNFNKVHFMMLLDYGTNSLTEFCDIPIGLISGDNEDYPRNYEELTNRIERFQPPITTIEDNTIYSFNNIDAHRGVPATGYGWRYFIRATINTQREFANEIRTQTQIYTDAKNAKW